MRSPERISHVERLREPGGFFVRDGARFRIVAGEPIFPDLRQPKEQEVARLTRAWSKQVEDIVRQFPEQWPWFHDRWKTSATQDEPR